MKYLSPHRRGARAWMGISLVATTVAIVSPLTPTAARQDLPRVPPADAGFRPERLAPIETVIREGLDAGHMPGCVLAFGRKGKLAWLRAYGHRQTEPEALPMTTDTVFDLASITKPVATATSIMMLLERGQLRLRDKVSEHFPGFSANGKQEITVLQLLTHQAGLIPDNSLSDYQQGAVEAWKRIEQLGVESEPGTRFAYSDVGFVVLGELVKKVSGLSLHEFTQHHLFGPLALSETGFLPTAELRARAAPTQQRGEHWMQGEVHDPRAFELGGVAGHAGLFSTAEDLAVYAQMLLQDGTYSGQRILGPATVELMTRSYDVSGNLRGLGWDKMSGYSSNRAENFSDRAYGHGGFTGTVLWIDPTWDLFFIFLSNRVHPDGHGNVNPLAGRLATIVASAIDPELDSRHGVKLTNSERFDVQAHAMQENQRNRTQVLSGLDVLQRQAFSLLESQRVGLITNHTGINRQGVSNVQLFHASPQVNLVALFSPEHGIAGRLDVSQIDDSTDPTTGLTIHSLYGATRKPTAEQLESIDTLVFDIQDIGTRFYTYISTLGLALEAAAEQRKRFVLLDRPNPINGVDVDGPVLDSGQESFVGFHALPVRHGMTAGELARMFVAERGLDIDLQIVPIEAWQRSQYFDETGLSWVDPSPNMRNVNQAILYPGIGLLETTNVSVGRGTDTPFERVGAPWIDSQQLATALNACELGGVCFTPITFRPKSSVFSGQDCQGVHVLITRRDQLNPLDMGFAIASTLRRLYADQWDHAAYNRLLADASVWQAIARGAEPTEIRPLYERELNEFRERRRTFLIYDANGRADAPELIERFEPEHHAPQSGRIP